MNFRSQNRKSINWKKCLRWTRSKREFFLALPQTLFLLCFLFSILLLNQILIPEVLSSQTSQRKANSNNLIPKFIPPNCSLNETPFWLMVCLASYWFSLKPSNGNCASFYVWFVGCNIKSRSERFDGAFYISNFSQ